MSASLSRLRRACSASSIICSSCSQRCGRPHQLAQIGARHGKRRRRCGDISFRSIELRLNSRKIEMRAAGGNRSFWDGYTTSPPHCPRPRATRQADQVSEVRRNLSSRAPRRSITRPPPCPKLTTTDVASAVMAPLAPRRARRPSRPIGDTQARREHSIAGGPGGLRGCRRNSEAVPFDFTRGQRNLEARTSSESS